MSSQINTVNYTQKWKKFSDLSLIWEGFSATVMYILYKQAYLCVSVLTSIEDKCI